MTASCVEQASLFDDMYMFLYNGQCVLSLTTEVKKQEMSSNEGKSYATRAFSMAAEILTKNWANIMKHYLCKGPMGNIKPAKGNKQHVKRICFH